MIAFFKLHKNLITEASLIAAAAISIAVGGINVFLLIFSVVMHELGHICAAYLNGARSENFTIHGFGVEISFPGKMPCPRSLFVISIGGPIMSLLLCMVGYILNQELIFKTNLSIAIINLLPVYPLDGGQMISSILSSFVTRKKLRKIMKLLGRFFGLITSFFGLIILFISGFNISLIYIGLFIFFSADKQPNPVTEITLADRSKIEKSSLFLVDSSLSVIEAADNLPINSIGAISDEDGRIISLITPLYLYKLAEDGTTTIKKRVEKT